MRKTAKPPTQLRERIRAARLRQGLSQAELAAAVGYTREHIVKFETGNTAGAPELAYKLSRALGMVITLDDLFPPGESQ